MLVTANWTVEAVNRLEVVVGGYAFDSEYPDEMTPEQWGQRMKELIDDIVQLSVYRKEWSDAGDRVPTTQ